MEESTGGWEEEATSWDPITLRAEASHAPPGAGPRGLPYTARGNPALLTPDAHVVVSKDKEGFGFCDFSTNNMDFLMKLKFVNV